MKKNDWRYNGYVEHVDSCALCELHHYTVDADFSVKLGLIEPFKCRKCSNCGLRWLSPRPTQKGYESIYTLDNYFGGDHSQESFSLILEKKRKLLFRNRLKQINKYITHDSRPIKILDIGAATGQFVYEAQAAGFNAIGIELSHEARYEAKKKYSITLYGKTLNDLIIDGHKFDAIHMNHVFEHLLDPAKCLQECKHLLTTEGVLVIEVPQQFYNDIDRLKKILHINKQPFFNPYSLHHAYFYTPLTLNLFLKKYGFKICRIRTSNPSNTPLFPPSLKNTLLFIYLFFSDFLHKGGNIIEIFSKK